MEKTMVVSGKVVETRDTRKSEKEMARSSKQGHVAIWLEVLKDVSRQWELAELGRVHYQA